MDHLSESSCSRGKEVRWPGTLHQKSCISSFQSERLEARGNVKMEEMIVCHFIQWKLVLC